MEQQPDGAAPAVRPLDVDGVGAVAVGTAVWALLALVLWPSRPSLEEQGRGWWWWVCVTGAGLGLLGLPYVLRRRRVYRSAASASSAVPPTSPAPSGGSAASGASETGSTT